MTKPLRHRRHRKTLVSQPRQQRTFYQLLLFTIETLMLFTLVIGIALLMYFAYQRVTQEAFLPISRVLIDKPLVYADASSLVDVVKKNGEPDWVHLNVKELAAQMRELSWVESLTVEKRWPDAIAVNVTERIPVVKWGDDGYLDPEGNVFTLPPRPALDGLFKVHGPKGYEQTVLKRYRQFAPWLADHNIFIESVTLDPRLVWHVTLEGGIDVMLGRENLNNRLKKLVVVYERVVKDKQNYIEKIDLRYQDGFSVHWKEGVKPQSDSDT